MRDNVQTLCVITASLGPLVNHKVVKRLWILSLVASHMCDPLTIHNPMYIAHSHQLKPHLCALYRSQNNRQLLPEKHSHDIPHPCFFGKRPNQAPDSL